MFEELNKRRQAVAYNIAKSFENDIEKAIGAGYDLEGGNGDEVAKAHQVGDVHSNGKWVWTEYAPGKFDWRGIKKNATEKKQKVEGSGSKEVDDFMDKVKIFNNKYTDISKVSVVKTPKGNWDVSYDGHCLGIINADQLSEKTAKKMGWLKTDSKKLTGSKRDADAGSITLKITSNGSGVVKLSDSVNAKWQDVKDEDFGGRIIGIKIDGKLGAKAFPYSFDSMKRKKYNLYTFEEAKAEAEKYLNNEMLKLTQQG